MFESDRTCCVCRIENRATQIHHIDSDPSNNNFENLAVVCLDHHSEAHSKNAFARNLTPDLLRKYNQSWREIIRQRLSPASDSAKLELTSEALLEISLDCHSWKVRFMRIAQHELKSGAAQDGFVDVWDSMEAHWLPTPNGKNYALYRPLFTEALDKLQTRFYRSMSLFSDVLPFSFRATLIRASRQLAVEKDGYILQPAIIQNFHSESVDDADHVYLRARFLGVIRVLRGVSREADKLREDLRLTPVKYEAP